MHGLPVVLWAALGVALAVGSAAQTPLPFTPVTPPLPSWAARRALDTFNRNSLFNHNRRLAEQANATSETYDVVFYGDSLTGLLVLQSDNAAVFDEYFGSAAGWNSARLGVGGSDVEELTWRMMVNGEKLAEDPLVVVVLIGINNELDSNPASKLDVLLSWMAAAMPRSKILVVTPLPSVLGKSGALHSSYRVVVRKHPGVALSACGSDLNPRDDTLFTDGLHLTAAGYREYFNCLKPQLEALRKLASAQRSAS